MSKNKQTKQTPQPQKVSSDNGRYTARTTLRIDPRMIERESYDPPISNNGKK